MGADGSLSVRASRVLKIVRLEPVSRTKVAGSPFTSTLSKIKLNRLLTSTGTIVAFRGVAEGSWVPAETGIRRRAAHEILQNACMPQPWISGVGNTPSANGCLVFAVVPAHCWGAAASHTIQRKVGFLDCPSSFKALERTLVASQRSFRNPGKVLEKL